MATAVTAPLLALTLLGGCVPPLAVTPPRSDGALAPRPSLFDFPWVWTDERGERVAFSRWRGEPLVVAGIYSQCRVTCPRTISKLRDAYVELRRRGLAAQFLLVTINPTVDTPERLRRFKQSEGFPEEWRLLSGSVAQTRELADYLDIHVMDGGEHLVHDARIVVFDSRGAPARSIDGSIFDDGANVL
ncbi:MAG TPA: SCO family protein [Polyangiaceae bacterium]|nr:SCO family protein [Polyangiaceae bacterium]